MSDSTKALKATSWKVIGRLLIALALLVILIGIITSVIYFSEVNRQKEIITEKEEHAVEMLREMITIHLAPVTADLLVLSENRQLQELIRVDNETDLDNLADLFLSYSKSKRIFDQIRLLDEQGMEIVRVNFNKGEPYIVPKDELQHKGERYYFNDTFQLNHGEIYVSPVDLNIENGQIEQPAKPMVRLGMPVFDDLDQKRGVLLLNYSAVDLFEHFEGMSIDVAVGEVMLLNPDGFWLKSPKKEDEWGFMYEDRAHLTFGNAFSSAWKQISRDDSGQFDTEDGLFTFTTLYPLSESMKSSTGSPEPFEPSETWVEHNKYYWKIVTRVSPSILVQEPRELLNRILLLDGILIVISAATFWSMFYSSLNRKRAVEALRRAHDELEMRVQERTKDLEEARAKDEAIIKGIGEGLIVTDEKGKILLVNEAFEKLLGWKEEEVVGKDMVEIVPKYDEDGKLIPRSERSVSRVLSGEVRLGSISTVADTHYYLCKDKSKLPVTGVVTAIMHGGKIAGAVQVFQDITREKEIIRMKDEFVNIAAHDLRTPATLIKDYISRVLDGDAGEVSDKAREMLSEAYEGNERSIRLVNDFLSVSRLERGKVKVEPKEADLGKIIEESMSNFDAKLAEKGLVISYKKEKLPKVLADEEKTIQVMNNLIGNAIKFTKEGEITISNEIKDKQVITHITDTGVGIDEDGQKHLFEKYYRKSETTGEIGLGLGLYICKMIIENSNGKIWAKSEKGKGSTFSFSLPIVEK